MPLWKSQDSQHRFESKPQQMITKSISKDSSLKSQPPYKFITSDKYKDKGKQCMKMSHSKVFIQTLKSQPHEIFGYKIHQKTVLAMPMTIDTWPGL